MPGKVQIIYNAYDGSKLLIDQSADPRSRAGTRSRRPFKLRHHVYNTFSGFQLPPEDVERSVRGQEEVLSSRMQRNAENAVNRRIAGLDGDGAPEKIA